MSAAQFYNSGNDPQQPQHQHYQQPPQPQQQQHFGYQSGGQDDVVVGPLSFEDALSCVRGFLSRQQGSQWDDSATYMPELQHYQSLSQEYKGFKKTLQWNNIDPQANEAVNKIDYTLFQLENSPTISRMSKYGIGFNMYHLVNAFELCLQERGQAGGRMQSLMAQAGDQATAAATNNHQIMQTLRTFQSEVPNFLQTHGSFAGHSNQSSSSFNNPNFQGWSQHLQHPGSTVYLQGQHHNEHSDSIKDKKKDKLEKEGKDLEKARKKEEKERKNALKKQKYGEGYVKKDKKDKKDKKKYKGSYKGSGSDDVDSDESYDSGSGSSE